MPHFNEQDIKLDNQQRRLERIDRTIQQMEAVISDIKQEFQSLQTENFRMRLEKAMKQAQMEAKRELESEVKLLEGPKGEDADPEEVAKTLKNDDNFLESVKGEKGEQGPPVNPEEVAFELMSREDFIEKTKGDKGEDGEDGSPDDGETIINKINEAPQGLKIKREHLELPEDTEGPRGGITLGGGGGDLVTYSTKDGTITGDIDGSNDTFTLQRPLKNPVVFLNGVRRTKDEDYTVSSNKKQITFNTAPRSGRGPITVDGQAL